jgi:hypothetical protein
VSPVFSLFSQCLYIIKNNLEHIYPTPVKSVKKRLKLETSTSSSCSIPQTSETTEDESDNNPFHKIRKLDCGKFFKSYIFMDNVMLNPHI